MIKRIISNIQRRFRVFRQFDSQMDVGEHFMNVFLVCGWFFLVEQLILSIWGTYFNFLVTLGCLVITTIFILAIDIPQYTHKIKYYLFFSLMLAMVLWWFSGFGLFGPMPHYMALMVFMFVIIFEGKEQKNILILTVSIFIALVILESLYPEWVQDYDLFIKKGDIISAMLFVSLTIIFSFRFIKRAFLHKQKEMSKQYEASKLLNEELDHFVYRTSHDLRAPISSCMGLISLMKDNPNPAKIQYYLTLQERSLQKMDAFIGDVLKYSRNKHHALLHEVIDFQQIYEEVLQQNAHNPASKRLHFSFENQLTAPFFGDSLRIKMRLCSKMYDKKSAKKS
ncbi:MAG: histidine kinase dimerization/phospho-acceptor domain-containing protein [Bacteroidia bacterium]